MSTLPPRLTLSGAPGSPYTRKMLAVLRYRHIPYRFLIGLHGQDHLPKAKVGLLPTFYLPDAEGQLQAVTDSTPIIRRLEAEVSGRAVRPTNPALALLEALLEDYGDEWLTKAMFHYRWHYADDIARASAILPSYRARLADGPLKAAGAMFADRQIPRLRYVGSNEATWGVIEASYMRFLDAMEAHLTAHGFLLGERPGACDFGVFGQLTQLALFDPTPMALTTARAPRVAAWTSVVEDLSGLEPTEADWFDPAALPDTLKAIFSEVGRVYAPLLIANARAVQSGAEEVRTQIDGQPWVQQPFTYQAKCLMWLRQEYGALDTASRGQVDAALAGTGCEVLFA